MMQSKKTIESIRRTLVVVLSLLMVSNMLTASAQNKKRVMAAGAKNTSVSRKKKDSYYGWEMYQASKSMGTNRMLLCANGMKIINPLMSMAFWPKTNQLVLINNSNHKYFVCSKEKFPHYVKMLGFDIFSTPNKNIKYSEWKKLDSEKVAGMDCVLYQRQGSNLPPNAERKEQTWVSHEISLPQTLYEVYSELSGRPDACRFGFPMRSKVITNMPPDGFKVHVDFDTKEITEKQFIASDFLAPKDYVEVKEFSEYLLNDSESKSGRGENESSSEKLQSAVSQFKSKAHAVREKERAEEAARRHN